MEGREARDATKKRGGEGEVEGGDIVSVPIGLTHSIISLRPGSISNSERGRRSDSGLAAFSASNSSNSERIYGRDDGSGGERRPTDWV